MRSQDASSGRSRAKLGKWLLLGTLLQPVLSVASAIPPDRPVGMRSDQAGADDDGNAAALFATPTTRDHIGRVIVPVMINGRGPFRFIVDTGANRSTITPKLVTALGLKLTGESTIVVNGITGAAQAFFVTVDRLQAGDLTVDGTALPVVWAPVMAGADGILGAAGLREKSLLIDFQRNRVEIAHHVETLWRTQAVRIHALPPTRGLITLDAKVGRVRVIAIIDTGSERTLGNLALHEALRRPKGRGVVAQLTSVYGATEDVEAGEIEAAPPIMLDSLHINDVSIVYGDFHVFKVWGLNDSPAMIIGMDVLGTVASLSIDFKNQDVYITSSHDGHAVPFTPGALSESAQRR